MYLTVHFCLVSLPEAYFGQLYLNEEHQNKRKTELIRYTVFIVNVIPFS